MLRAARYLRGEEVEPYDGPEMVDASYMADWPAAEDDADPDQQGPEMAGGGNVVATQVKPLADLRLESRIPETAVVGKPETKVDAVKLGQRQPRLR